MNGSVVANREALFCKNIGAHKTLNRRNNVIRNRFYKMHKKYAVFLKTNPAAVSAVEAIRIWCNYACKHFKDKPYAWSNARAFTSEEIEASGLPLIWYCQMPLTGSVATR